MDFLTVVNVFRVLLTVELFFLDSYDLLASQVTNLDLFTIVDILGMLTTIKLCLFDSNNLLASKVADLDILWLPSCIAPNWVTAILDDGRNKLTVIIEPYESSLSGVRPSSTS